MTIESLLITAQPAAELLELVDELAAIERPRWAEVSANIPAWHPRLEGDDDGGDEDGDDDEADDAGDGDDDSDDDEKKDKKGKRKGSDDDDEDDGELGKAQRAAAAANRELRKVKSEQEAKERKAKQEAGEWETLAKDWERKYTELEAKVASDHVKSLAKDALAKLHAKNPGRYVAMLDLEDVEDESSAERAVRKLKREDPSLFNDPKSRQKRGGGDNDEDDDDDDDDDRDDRKRGRRNGVKQQRKRAKWDAPVG